MKLALVTETYPPEINGVAMTLSQLVESLRRRGHQAQIVRPRQRADARGDPSDGSDLVLARGLPIPRYPDLRFGLPCGARLAQAWRIQKPDIVHVATEGPLGLSAIRAARRLGIPVTSTFHTNFHSYCERYRAKPLARPALAYLRWIHNQTACTMAPTRALADELGAAGFRGMEVFGRGVRLDVFNPSARDESLRSSWGVGPDTPAILHVGRLAAEKNYELLGETFQAIRAAEPSAVFVIVGGGPLRARLEKAMPFARFVGPIGLDRREELARVYASADLFCFPSLTETYGNVATEAMACGNAVVAFDYAAAALHIRDGENGALAACSDRRDFIAASVRLARDRALRRRFGQAAARCARAFDWEPVTDRFESILLRCSVTKA